jgi:hypothetical protein
VQAPGITPKHYTRLEKPAGGIHPNVLRTYVNIVPKKFYTIGLEKYKTNNEGKNSGAKVTV